MRNTGIINLRSILYETVFFCRLLLKNLQLYSRRRAKRLTEKIIQSLRKEEPDATGGAASR